jgi:hypothetical protein
MQPLPPVHPRPIAANQDACLKLAFAVLPQQGLTHDAPFRLPTSWSFQAPHLQPLLTPLDAASESGSSERWWRERMGASYSRQYLHMVGCSAFMTSIQYGAGS